MRSLQQRATRRSALNEAPIDPFIPAEIRRLVATFGSPLLILDCERVRTQYRRLAAALPRVVLYYALKPLPHPAVVQALAELGAHFDLATTGEIGVVKELGISAERCIHTHPVKRDADIRAALDFGLQTSSPPAWTRSPSSRNTGIALRCCCVCRFVVPMRS